MAINYPDYMPNYNMGETEEERRRREAEEAARAAAAQVQTFPVEPVAPVAPVSLEPLDLANTEVQSTQVKTYGDGSQEEIVKRQIPAEQPVAPVQPEMQPQPQVQSQPQPQMAPAPQPQAAVAPQQTTDPAEIQRRQEAMRAMMTQQAPPAPAPVPTQAVAPTQMPDIGNVQANIGQPPVPGPGVQVAGPAAMPPAAMPPAAAPAPVANLQQVSAQMGATPTPTAAPTFESRFAAASADAVQLLQLRQDTTLTKEQSQLAGRQAQLQLEQELGPIKAKDQIGKMTENDLARVIKSKSQEGSWVKLALLGFISPELAGKEATKLGLNDKWSASATADGTPVLIKTRDGVPIEGYNAATDKSLSAKELVAATAGAAAIKGVEVGADTFADPTGKVPGNWVLERKPGGSVYRQVGTNKVATEEQANALRKTGVQGTLGDQRARLIQEMNIKLQGKAGEEAMAIQRQYNQLLVGQGLAPMQPSETPIIAPQIGGETPPALLPSAPAATKEQQDQARRLDGDIAGINREIKNTPPREKERLGILNDELQKATQKRQQLGGVVPSTPLPPSGNRPTQQQLEAQGAGATSAATEAAKNAPLIRRADEESFVKYKNEDLLPKADSGNRLAGIRRDQISGPDGVLNNPEIAGLLSGTGGQAREFQNIFRDIVGGNFEKVDDMSARIKQAGLDPRMKEVLQIQLQRQREVTPLLIREVAPVGAITDFEQRMAKEAGIDVLRQGLYASLTNLTRSQFQSDVAAYKAVFAERNPQLRTRAEFDRAWNAEKSRLDASYRKVYEDRAKYLGQYNRDGSNNNATIVAFRDHYPVPAFDQGTGQFRFSGYSQRSERPPLSSFERR
jgi:hypothetical protein